MAKVRFGSVAAQVSGSIGGDTYSRNRYGAYIRTRAVPTKSFTTFALDAKSRLIECSQAWAALTDAQRLAWRSWAAENPVSDVFGEKQVLDGHAAYVQINNRMLWAGESKLSTPPLLAPPPALTSLTATWDIGAGTFALTFAATPIGATNKLWIDGCVLDAPGVTYVQNLVRHIGVSAANQATGYDSQTLIEARLGALAAGKVVNLFVRVFSTATGQISAPLRVSGVVVST